MNAPHPPDRFLLAPSLRARLLAEHRPKPGLYWADLLVSATVAWGSFVALFFVPILSVATVGLTLVSIVAFLRAGSFMHELQHRNPRELPGLHVAWNLLVGIPALVPSLMMHPHASHHFPGSFATFDDPEYAPIARWPRWRILNSLVAYAAIAAFMPIRWGVVTPLSRLHPALRRHAIGQLSTADVARGYDRPDPTGAPARIFRLQEWACFAVVWGVLAANIAGWIPWELQLHRLVVMGVVLAVNQARLLVVHRYDRSEGVPVGPREQTLDAWTFGDDPVSRVVAPIGFSYHALHHELPTLPYHAMGEVHRHLLAELPAEHPYRTTQIDGFLGALRLRWAEAGENPSWPLPAWGADQASAAATASPRAAAEG